MKRPIKTSNPSPPKSKWIPTKAVRFNKDGSVSMRGSRLNPSRLRKNPESQYVSSYLSENASRGEGRGLTPATFLGYHLHGRAKGYMTGYARALANALNKRVASGQVFKGKSAGGGTAYYPT